jgi:hypothetical protein
VVRGFGPDAQTYIHFRIDMFPEKRKDSHQFQEHFQSHCKECENRVMPPLQSQLTVRKKYVQGGRLPS